MSFGAKLMEQRKKCGFSQEQLADKIGVSRQAISRWEAEDTLPDANNLKKISELFQISIDDLLENPCFRKEKMDGLEQEPQRAPAQGRPLFWAKFLIAFGLLGLLFFYILSTQIPATEMWPAPINPTVRSLETNEVIPVVGKAYFPHKVYSFFPFLHTYHLEGLAWGLTGMSILGLFWLIYIMRKSRRRSKSIC